CFASRWCHFLFNDMEKQMCVLPCSDSCHVLQFHLLRWDLVCAYVYSTTHVCRGGCICFSSGRFYFEVKVKGKTAWTVGVAKDSIYRRGKIPLGPSDGFWTVWLRNGNEYSANDDRPVRLFPNQHPQKVGVFVDYEKGLVTFYDVDSADFLYAFTGCAFTEELYPYVSHCICQFKQLYLPLLTLYMSQSCLRDKDADMKT
uniref:B30.2/SPRY domain-containing protein n=1 Tax=Seriola lalandi dorsalis TaxID=1841481 RepID=A0A3B4Y245_SERLL